MLLLDRNNEPTSTVYYLAAAAYAYLGGNDGLDSATLYQRVTQEQIGKRVNYQFFTMALDFLYLLDAITVDEKGGLHVHQNIAHL